MGALYDGPRYRPFQAHGYIRKDSSLTSTQVTVRVREHWQIKKLWLDLPAGPLPG